MVLQNSSPNRAQVIALLEEIHSLMTLKGENPFKVRAFEKARGVIAELPEAEDLKARAEARTLTELAGIGKGLSEVLTEFLLKGTSSARDELKASIPAGLVELTQVPGLGPKKAQLIIDELDIHTVAELEYACRENRLLKLKGFGDKIQAKILESIQFLKAGEGQCRISDAFPLAEALFKDLYKSVNSGRHPAALGLRVSEAGALRRRLEILGELEFVVELPPGESAPAEVRRLAESSIERFRRRFSTPLAIRLHFAGRERFGYELALRTATPEHWRALGSPSPFDAATEEQFYEALKLPVIPPESRETGEEVELARSGALSGLLPWDGIQGVFHNHTNRSDGVASLEEMIVKAKSLGYRYIGISDHSQTAFYAQGLKVPTLIEQEKEVRDLQEKHPEIRVFWGIESDILSDGSLDYEAEVLERFDFVVASIHSRFNMDREAMTARIIKAVQNPHTRFLGHATGRLLLGRKGYDVDMEYVIQEAAKCDVAIEINANPARLDIDWRWGPQLRKSGTLVSVNPHAHYTDGLEDTRYGIAVARKALLPIGLVVNSRSVADVERWLARS